MLSLCWGLSWVAVARLTDEPESTTTGIAAILAVVVVVAVTLGMRIAAMRSAHAGRAVGADATT